MAVYVGWKKKCMHPEKRVCSTVRSHLVKLQIGVVGFAFLAEACVARCSKIPILILQNRTLLGNYLNSCFVVNTKTAPSELFSDFLHVGRRTFDVFLHERTAFFFTGRQLTLSFGFFLRKISCPISRWSAKACGSKGYQDEEEVRFADNVAEL